MPQPPSSSQHPGVTEDERLLNRIPRERRAFTKTDSWKVLRIMGEFVEGFDTLSDIYNAVTIFGSARTTSGDAYYEKAVETARLLAREGFAVITGGGPGIMEAANRGAQEGRAFDRLQHRAAVRARHEPVRRTAINFRYFFVRKTMFVKYAKAFSVFPGRLWHDGRVVRGAHTDPDGEGGFPGCAVRQRILGGNGRLAARPGGREGKIVTTDLDLFQ